MKKLVPAVVLAAGMLLTGCAGGTTTRLSVEESCTFLNGDTFVPTGSPQEQAGQISQHYQEVADKVAPEISAPIGKMADIMKQVAESPTGAKTADQTAGLTEQLNKIGEYCK
ncbi:MULTISPECIES: hypothetical protein [Arthrobacter]|uniref:Lipoprotein n=1 Tax=Arthrobacter oryzae TaxID=409290 RepID=A0A3N0BP02_9MICC|nr:MULTISPECIES: hypothetical protein [Arthrobacter]QYF88443.1 hypothetical protein KY499_09060 [Arthrobacter sp. PAMC25284]RNL50067.1 hypothetical protein D7003_18390 [Arthrobacter oryzae]